MTEVITMTQSELVEILLRLDAWSDRVPAALALAEEVHGKQRRSDGGPYLEEHIYPVTAAVAEYLIRVDPTDVADAVLIAILHDTIEDSPTLNEQMIAERFADTVALGVAALTKPSKRGGKSGDATAEDEERYVARVARSALPVRVVKVFDRLNNLAAVHQRPPDKRQKYLAETRANYIDLARTVDETLARRMTDLLAAQEACSEERSAS